MAERGARVFNTCFAFNTKRSALQILLLLRIVKVMSELLFWRLGATKASRA